MGTKVTQSSNCCCNSKSHVTLSLQSRTVTRSPCLVKLRHKMHAPQFTASNASHAKLLHVPMLTANLVKQGSHSKVNETIKLCESKLQLIHYTKVGYIVSAIVNCTLGTGNSTDNLQQITCITADSKCCISFC